MPKLMAFKNYPALIDLYTTKKDDFSGAQVLTYEDPIALECNFSAVRGSTLNDSGIFFSTEDTLRIELRPEDAKIITYSSVFGNLRSKVDGESNDYSLFSLVPTPAYQTGRRIYTYVPKQARPIVDGRGIIVSVELYLSAKIVYLDESE